MNNIILLIVLLVFILGAIGLFIFLNRKGYTYKYSNHIRSYLSALYPQSDMRNLTDLQIQNMYHHLDWYYLPLAGPVNWDRFKPIKGPYKNTETRWFMADGTDCGDPASPGEFTCSVFGGSCKTWEFGNGNDGGRPYQYIATIKPYKLGKGFPNNAYIECVAFPCEELGRMLLSKDCNTTAPTWQEFLNNPQAGKNKNWYSSEHYKHCPNKTSCDNNDPGCTVTSGSMSDTCCWDYEKKRPDNSVCDWPTTCMAKSETGEVFDNYCGVPCGYINCDDKKYCDWYVENEVWSIWLSKQKDPYYGIIEKLKNSRPKYISLQPRKPNINATPRPDVSVKKTMFYWCKGYGKFLNMGKTGIFFNYVHFLLTCNLQYRWTFPQILQTATMDGGNNELALQFYDLMSGKHTDKRKYLQGIVTTLRGSDYEAKGDFDLLSGFGPNVQAETKLYNPLDDDNLVQVDKLTVTKYYDPNKKVLNPQYNKKIRFTPLQACYLLQAMHIYGATANSTNSPFVTMSGKKEGGYGSGVYPFGVHFAGSNLGHCVYQRFSVSGWKSAQFTQMPTGAGGKKYCNYPEYDFEIVFIKDKEEVCKSEFKLLDPTKDIDTYNQFGYVNGSTPDLDIIDFTPEKMKLTERNVPDDWQGPHPNNTQYTTPQPPVKIKSKCPYKDDVYSK